MLIFIFYLNSFDTNTEKWNESINIPTWYTNTENWPKPKFEKEDWPTKTEKWPDQPYFPSNSSSIIPKKFNFSPIIIISLFLIFILTGFLIYFKKSPIDEGFSSINDAILLNKNIDDF